MKMYYKIRAIGRILLRIFNIMLVIILLLNTALFGVMAYYYSQAAICIQMDEFCISK